MRKTLLLSLSLIFTIQLCAQSFTENFNNIGTLTGWDVVNKSVPVGTQSWTQGFPAGTTGTAFVAQAGCDSCYLGNSFQTVDGQGPISDWMIAPAISVSNGDTLSFYTRNALAGGTEYPDRLQLRAALNPTGVNVGADENSVGDYSLLLFDVNPSLVTAVYPRTWTKYEYIATGLPLPNTQVRVAFRYFVADGGANGANSFLIGIDEFHYGQLAPLGVPTVSTSGSISVSPNPTSNLVNISFKEPLIGQANVVIMNQLAQYLLVEKVPQGTEMKSFDISTLPNGVYTVQVYLPNNTVTSSIIVKQ
jgi:Secretion system C-terminal sorting domain